jgi:hypothetical protein
MYCGAEKACTAIPTFGKNELTNDDVLQRRNCLRCNTNFREDLTDAAQETRA